MVEVMTFDECLNRNRRDLRFLFNRSIEGSLDIHLGVADKFALASYLRQFTYLRYVDVFAVTVDFLNEMGYTSDKFSKFTQHQKKIEKYWGEVAEQFWMKPNYFNDLYAMWESEREKKRISSFLNSKI